MHCNFETNRVCPIKSFLPSKTLTAYEVASLVFWGTPSLTRIVTSSLTSAKRVAILINLHGRPTIHPGIFGGRTLWADSGPPRMNTIASRDQFKPIRMEEDLVVNYNGLASNQITAFALVY